MRRVDVLKHPLIVITFLALTVLPSNSHGLQITDSKPSNQFSSQDDTYYCLEACKCQYENQELKLEIQCSATSSNQSVRGQSLNLGPAVRSLVIKNASIAAKPLSHLLPSQANNTLAEISLSNVEITSLGLFLSKILELAKDSLRKVTILNTILSFPDTIDEDSNKGGEFNNLDSLTIRRSHRKIAEFFLHHLPSPISNIEITECSLSTLESSSLTNLPQLVSLNLSRNFITGLPDGLFLAAGSVQSIDLSHNLLLHLQEDVFQGLSHVLELDLSYNHINYIDAEVFSHMKDLYKIDLSNNDLIQFFEPYFKHNAKLHILKMSNAWISDIFLNKHSHRSQKEMEGMITTLAKVEKLDLSDNQMRLLPETISHVPNLKEVKLQGNRWSCKCSDRWYLKWIYSRNVSVDLKDTFCHTESEELPILSYMQHLMETCHSKTIISMFPFQYFAIMGQGKKLQCHPTNNFGPRVTWITPTGGEITETKYAIKTQGNVTIDPDGGLLIDSVTGKDYGLYLCVISYGDDFNVTHYVHLGMDVSIFKDVRLISIIVGLISSFGFLAVVLLAQVIRCLLLRSGLRCIAVMAAKQARRSRKFFDVIEQNRINQFQWLKQNYKMQAKKVQDNFVTQLEKIRDSYTNQTRNLSDFRDYSAQQLTTMRDQYQDQIRRVTAYSARRLGKVRENYVFNRNRVGKFSSHQLIRLREAYKWQAQALNKILENLPQGLNLDACRGVANCARTDSVYFEEEFGGEAVPSCSAQEFNKDTEQLSLLIPKEFLDSYLKRDGTTETLDDEVAMVEISVEGDKNRVLLSDNSDISDCEDHPTV